MADIQTQLPVKLTNNTNTAAITSGNALQVDIGATTANSTPIVVTGSGTAGSAATGVVTVQGIASGTAVIISGTVTANAGTGNFGVNITQISGSSVSTAASGIIKVGISDSSGSAITLGQTTMSASVPVVIASNQSAITVAQATATNLNAAIQAIQNAATSGTITTNTSTVAVSMSGFNGAIISVNGTYAGVNFTFEASDDGGTTYYTVAAARSDNSATQTATGVLTSNSSIMWDVYTGAVTNFRVRATAYTSGTANIHITPTVMAQDPAVITNTSGGTQNVNITQVSGSSVSTAATGIIKVGISDSSGTSITLGQTTMSASVPVVIASNQSAVTVTGSGSAGSAASGVVTVQGIASMTPISDNITQIAGSSVSTAATGVIKVGIADSSGTSITLGQTTMSASVPVTLASNQSALATTPGEVTTGIVTSYNTSSAVANSSTGTLTYTVTVGKTLFLKQIIASSSGGPCRVQVDYGAGPTIIFVGFYSAASPFLSVVFQQPVSIAASTAVNIKILNNAGASQDVYGTIMGHEQ